MATRSYPGPRFTPRAVPFTAGVLPGYEDPGAYVFDPLFWPDHAIDALGRRAFGEVISIIINSAWSIDADARARALGMSWRDDILDGPDADADAA